MGWKDFFCCCFPNKNNRNEEEQPLLERNNWGDDPLPDNVNGERFKASVRRKNEKDARLEARGKEIIKESHAEKKPKKKPTKDWKAGEGLTGVLGKGNRPGRHTNLAQAAIENSHKRREK